jgi:Fe-S oxidoreductase
MLGLTDPKVVPVVRDAARVTDESDAVFYFPGCGSERQFSQVGLATLAWLYELGAQTVLPPTYLCCGYPQTAGGDRAKGDAITMQNRVLFHRVANTLNYLDIKTVLVSCGTCLDQLQEYQFDKIFPGCRIMDIHEYLAEKGVKLDGVKGTQYLYHDPCHTPMKLKSPMSTVRSLVGDGARLTERCCGEAGTFATSRPDIATQVKFRKAEDLDKNRDAQIAAGASAAKAGSRCSPPAPPVCRACPAIPTTTAWTPTTSSWSWRRSCWARTGWRNSWGRPTMAASKRCCCRRRPWDCPNLSQRVTRICSICPSTSWARSSTGVW